MIRLFVAAILALCVHVALLRIEIPWSPPIMMVPQSRTVSIDLVTFQKPVAKPPPPEPKVIKPRPKPKPKPVVKPVVEPKPVPQPVEPEPLAEPVKVEQGLEPDLDMEEGAPEPEPAAMEEISTDEDDDRAAVQASVPRYDLNPPPHYPRMARRRNYQGTVMLDVQVTVDGRVAQVRIAASSGYAILDRSAVKSVKDWRFTPARRGGRPIEMWVKVPLRYKLK